MKVLFVLAVLLPFMLAQQKVDQDLLVKLEARIKNVETRHERINSQMEKVLEGTSALAVTRFAEQIRTGGLQLGNSWQIAEEGTGSYEALVFRDLSSARNRVDRRYAFFQQRYVDL